MKVYSKSRMVLISLCISLFFINTDNTFSQEKSDMLDSTLRAVEGDTVSIVLNYVKADKREQFEKYMELFLNALDKSTKSGKLSKKEIEFNTKMRYLIPFQLNQDSTYTYVFLADPLVSDVNTSMMYFLKMQYTEEEAKKHFQMFKESLAKSQVSYRVVQTEY